MGPSRRRLCCIEHDFYFGIPFLYDVSRVLFVSIAIHVCVL